MAVKTFTGSTLSSSDVNTYLANAGLVYITSGTLSSTATNFASVFNNTTYRNYRIVISSIQMSATGDLYFRLLSGTTPNQGTEYYWAMTGLTAGNTQINAAAGAQTLGFLGYTNQNANNLAVGAVSLDIYAPNASERTFVNVQSCSFPNVLAFRSGMAEHNLTNAYDGIQFLTNAATTFGGNVHIYGYRQA